MRFPSRIWIVCGIALGGLLLCLGRFLLSAAAVTASTAPVPQRQALPLSALSQEVFSVEGVPGAPELWAAARDGLYRSPDAGRTWIRVPLPMSPSAGITALRWNSAASGSIWIGSKAGLFRGSGEPLRWKRLLPRVSAMDSVAVDRSGRLLLAASGDEIWESQDGGEHWRSARIPAQAGKPVQEMAFHPGRRGLCFAATPSALLISEDSGGSWRVNRRLGGEAEEIGEMGEENEPSAPDGILEEKERGGKGLAVCPRTGAVYAGTHRGVAVSRDFGKSWQPLPAAGLGFPVIQGLFADPVLPGHLYAVTPAGLFFYEEGRDSWKPLLSPMPGRSIHALARGFSEEVLWLGGEAGLFRLSLEAAGSKIGPIGLAGSKEGEPTIQDLHRMAIHYAEVSPDKIRRWRWLARWKAFVPRLTLGLDRDRDATVVSSTAGGITRFSIGPDRRSAGLGVDFTWDLADLVWSTDQTAIDVRSRLMVQLRQDLLQEVTRVYFERRRLLAEFERNPTADPALESERALRVQELTAYLDAYTGGGFSEKD